MGADSMFLGYFLIRTQTRRQKASGWTGRRSRAHQRKTLWPASSCLCRALTEQTAIAAVLSDMDAELSALEARRDKTRALKQAMMQELLTGRTRLV